MARLRATVHGRVQGVGFRASTMRQARRLGLTGWVRNEPNGDVQLICEGPKSALADMVDWLERGFSSAFVTKVDTSYGEYQDLYDGFKIEY